VQGISKRGAVTGIALAGLDVSHGYIRAAHGSITGFDVPGAGGGRYQGTMPAAINDTGVIAGTYIDNGSREHGFIRAR